MFNSWRLLECGNGKEWKKISWVDKISHNVLAKVEEDR